MSRETVYVCDRCGDETRSFAEYTYDWEQDTAGQDVCGDCNGKGAATYDEADRAASEADRGD